METWTGTLAIAAIASAMLASGAAAQLMPPGHGAEPVTVVGTVTSGVECPALQDEDGKLYTLVPMDEARRHLGDRVTVTGVPQGMSFCMQGVTLEIREIKPTR